MDPTPRQHHHGDQAIITCREKTFTSASLVEVGICNTLLAEAQPPQWKPCIIQPTQKVKNGDCKISCQHWW